MALLQLEIALRRLNKDVGSRCIKHLHGQSRRLHTSTFYSIKTSRRTHSLQNNLYPSCNHSLFISPNLIHRHHQSTSHLHRCLHGRPNQSSSFFNLYGNNRSRSPSTHSHLPFHRIFKRFASMDVSKDYYQLLGVKKNSTKKEIRSSYLKLAKKWHPDLHKNEADKKNARNKFIEIQEAYEVLHDDQMRKKYDEMRRIGISQDQYAQREAYEKHAKSAGFTGRGASAYNNAWEDHFRRNMHEEWEKIRREQQDWARSQRQERHKYSEHQHPFGNPYMRNSGGPFGFNQHPFNQNPFSGHHQAPNNPLEGFFRTMIMVFGVFMALKLTGAILFGPPRDRRRPSGFDPNNGPHQYRNESPYYSQSNYDRYNHSLPGPMAFRTDKDRKGRTRYGDTEDSFDEQLIDEYDRNRKGRLSRTGQYIPPPPSMANDPRRTKNNPINGPKPVNPNRERSDPNKSEFDMGDGGQFVFTNPSGQTDDISSPQEQRRKQKSKRRSKYEKLLEEQRMVEDVYIRARRKQMQEQEFARQREMNKKFGRRRDQMPPPPPPSNSNDEEDPNAAWERYLNSKSGNEVRWRERGRSGRSG